MSYVILQTFSISWMCSDHFLKKQLNLFDLIGYISNFRAPDTENSEQHFFLHSPALPSLFSLPSSISLSIRRLLRFPDGDESWRCARDFNNAARRKRAAELSQWDFDVARCGGDKWFWALKSHYDASIVPRNLLQQILSPPPRCRTDYRGAISSHSESWQGLCWCAELPQKLAPWKPSASFKYLILSLHATLQPIRRLNCHQWSFIPISKSFLWRVKTTSFRDGRAAQRLCSGASRRS